jgi:hypothetical protein
MKAQATVIREVIAFSMGIMLVITLAIIMNQSFVPRLTTFATDKQMENLLSHTHYVLFNTYSLKSIGLNSQVKHTVDLPSDVASNSYRVYSESTNLCIELIGKPDKKCTSLLINATGSYISGSMLSIDATGSEIIFSNFLDNA